MRMDRQTADRQTADMTVSQVRDRLRAAHERIGREGRFALTLTQADRQADGYITHWVRPEPHAVEDCRAVGSGTLPECLDALDRYAARYRRRPTEAEIGRMLGLEPERPRFLNAAE